IAQGQRDLSAGRLAWLVVTHEGPLQYSNRAGQHALHRLIGQRLSVFAPAHGHRPRAADVTENQRRLDAARTVALYPTILGEGKAVELFAEILDHIVTLRLAMHEHIDTQGLLTFH